MAAKQFRTTDRPTSAGKHFNRQVKKLRKGPSVKIGVTQKAFDDEKRGSTGTFTLGEVAVVNEFGTADGRIPERSFIGWTHDEHRNRMIRLINDLRHEVLARRMSTSRALGIVGAEMQKLIKDRIVELKHPPNAPSTIIQKTRAGNVGDNPLVNTGQLLSRILWEKHGIN
jgi:hypothetical protein